ncbi:hypothetical protein NA57DRAFT_71798 [Rhizodiscina lignyota]|uniref:ABM domain-containing protein n=1 Tax=Rhizodiscina lignyota TaxID=1504668 RepID=A0A9P4IMS5_9PEZI|nr:hypothetical protein NA57DRAFT_71798 [Rhizodiscina lignyota]
MAPIFVIGHLFPRDQGARHKVIEALSDTARYSRANEPGVTKYAVTVPRTSSALDIFAFEEYADQAALDAHMASPPVAAIINLFTTQPELLASPTKVYMLSAAHEMIRSAVTALSDPTITFSILSNTGSSAPEKWHELVAKAEQRGDGVCMVLGDKDNAGSGAILVVEVGKSSGLSSDSGISQLQESHDLKLVEGYWWKRRDAGAKLA